MSDFELDAPAERESELARNRQAEPGPVHVVRDERVEDPLALVRRHARAGVDDVDADGPVRRRELELDPAAVGRPAKRVGEEVGDDLQHAIPVGDDDGRLTVPVDPVVDLAPARLLGERAVRMVEDAAEVDLLVPDREPVRLELREVEDVPHETLEPVRLCGHDLERRLDLLRLADDALAHRLDMAANRRERRPQLVRDGHEERALELLRLGQLLDHAPEAIAELRDLVAAACLGDLDVVPSRRDVLCGAREREHGAREPVRQPPEERGPERDPDRERQREPSEQGQPLLTELRDRLPDDEMAERIRPLREANRLRGGDELVLAAWWRELERDDALRVELDVAERRRRKRSEPEALAREDRRPDVEELVPARGLEVLGGELGRLRASVARAERGLAVQLRETRSLPPKLAHRLRAGHVLEEPHRERDRHEPEHEHDEEEEGCQSEAERPEHVLRVDPYAADAGERSLATL